MFETVLIATGLVVFLVAMFAFIRIADAVPEYMKMTPEEERQYEIDTQPVYAFATVTDSNSEDVVTAQILHIEDPERYPEVPAYENRKAGF